MRLGDAWRETSVDRSGDGATSTRVFTPSKAHDVRMEIFYRGMPLAEKDSEAFRDALLTAPSVIFEQKEQARPSQTEIKALTALQEALDSVGDNQVVNTRTDYLGASFIVDRIDALVWKGKNVLAVRGWFRDADQDLRLTEYCGLFIDGNPGDAQCQVEEIYLEAETEALYSRYLPEFKEFLGTIAWQQK
jgi:hypothetical protein